MEYAKKLWIFLLCLGFGLLLPGCRHVGQTDTLLAEVDTGDNTTVTVEAYGQDRKAELVSYKENPQRVVAVYQNSVETLLALGAGNNIGMAVSVQPELLRKDYRPLYENIPLKSLYGISKEQVLMYEPELIAAWYSTFSPNYLGNQSQWRKRGIATYIAPSSFGRKNEPQTLEDEYRFIRDLGKIFGRTERANEIVATMDKEIHTVVNAVKTMEKKPECIIIELEGKELRAYGKDTLGGNILMHLGVPLVYEGNHLSYEELIMLDPDIIFIVNLDETEEGGRLEEERVRKIPAFSGIKAVKNNRVYAVPLYEIYCSGIRSYDGIVRFTRGIYPEYKDK